MRLFFKGYVMNNIGDVKPPPSNGFDLINFLFWVSYIAGIGLFVHWLVMFFLEI